MPTCPVSAGSGDSKPREQYLGSVADAHVLPDLDQLLDGLPQAILPLVVVEDAGCARVVQNVGIPLMEVVPGEGPVIER